MSRIDENQREIVKALQQMGCTVSSLTQVGAGCPDLLVGVSGRNLLMEIKDGNKPASARKLTPAQVKWHDNWRGQKAVVESVSQAIELVNNSRSN